MALDAYMKDIRNHKILSREEELYLHNKIKAGDERAREEFIRNNLKLVVSIAKRYSREGDLLMDYIQEGNMGLLKAVDMFNPEKFNTRFSTYAMWWIKSNIRKFIVKNRMIRLPSHAYEDYIKLNNLESDYLSRHGNPPSYQYLAENMSDRRSNYMPKDIMLMHYNMRAINTTSLDSNINNDSGSTLLDLIPDKKKTPLDMMAEVSRTEVVNRYLFRLDSDTRDTIRLYYIEGMSKREISTKLGRNTEWVKTRISIGKRKLYHIISNEIGEEELENLVR